MRCKHKQLTVSIAVEETFKLDFCYLQKGIVSLSADDSNEDEVTILKKVECRKCGKVFNVEDFNFNREAVNFPINEA